MASPAIDEHLSLIDRRQLLPLQKFVAEIGVEGLAIAVLQWCSAFYAESLETVTDHKVCRTEEGVVRPET